VSTRRGVPAGVQFIGGVGGFAAGLVSLTALLGIYVAVQEGDLALAARFVPMLVLGVGHVVGLYGLVRLRRWGYRWTRRLFAVTLLVNLPGLQTGDPITLGTVVFSVFVLGYLWLADAKTFRPRPSGDSPPTTDPGDEPAEIDPGNPRDRSEEPIRIEDVGTDEDDDESDGSADPLAGDAGSTTDADSGGGDGGANADGDDADDGDGDDDADGDDSD